MTKYILHCVQSKLAAVYCVDSKSSYCQRSFHILNMRVYDDVYCLGRYFRFEVSLLSILCMLIGRMEMGTSRVSGDSDINT